MTILASDFSGLAWLGLVMLLVFAGAVLSLAAMLVLLVAAYRVRGTTLVAPLVWMMLSLALWACAVIAPLRDSQGTPRPADQQTIASAAILSMVCPIVAVLGARRPQNRIWPLVVGSLLAILILPELPNVLGLGDHDLAHSVWRWFFLGILLVGWLNYLPTRLMPATTLWCLPGLSWAWFGTMHWSMIFVPGLAAIVGVLSARRWRTKGLTGWNRVWRDFRNLYGSVWALRVMERTNALANSVGAAVALDWWGFHAAQPSQLSSDSAPVGTQIAPSPEQMALIEPGLRNLLRRFESDRWIDVRLAAANDRSNPGQ